MAPSLFTALTETRLFDRCIHRAAGEPTIAKNPPTLMDGGKWEQPSELMQLDRHDAFLETQTVLAETSKTHMGEQLWKTVQDLMDTHRNELKMLLL